jgi:hypothetical protein
MRLLFAFALSVWLLVWAAASAAQDAGVDAVSWGIRVPRGDSFGLPTPIRSVRLYDEPDSIRFQLQVGNESASPLVVNTERLRSEVPFKIVGESAEVSFDWLDSVITTESESGVGATSGSVLLAPKTTATWTIAARRTDRERFRAGSYRLVWRVPSISEAIRAQGGQLLSGRFFEGERALDIRIALPITPQEQSRMHQIVGDEAARDGDTAAATAAYEKAAGSDPSDRRTRAALFSSYMVSRRYRDAVNFLESIAGREGYSASLSFDLSKAYLASRDEANAQRALRAAGLTETQVVRALSEARDAIGAK